MNCLPCFVGEEHREVMEMDDSDLPELNYCGRSVKNLCIVFVLIISARWMTTVLIICLRDAFPCASLEMHPVGSHED